MKKFLVIMAVCVGLPLALMGLATPLKGVYAFKVTPSATAADVSATAVTAAGNGGKAFRSLRCGNLSATPAYIGHSGVDAGVGYPLCTDTAVCHDSVITVDGHDVWVIDPTDGGLTLDCLGGR